MDISMNVNGKHQDAPEGARYGEKGPARWTARAGSLVCAAALLAPGAQAVAQEIEEILVTARKRTESIQDIPVAVTAFDPARLEALGVEDLEDIGVAVPNLNLVQGRGSSSSANIFIRGMGQPDALQTFDPAVGIYLDGVYISRIQGALFKLFDVERLEVLRGPQGTLYGKNTMAGAINIVTHKPGDSLAGRAEVTAGNYDRREGRFYVSGPLVEGVLAGSVSGLVAKRDGFVTDPVTGRDYNDDDTEAGRINLVATPTDGLQVGLSADYSRQDTALTLGRAEAPIVRVDLGTGAVTPIHLPEAGEFDFETRTSFAGDEGQELESYGAALTVDWELGNGWVFKSITAYRELDLGFYVDIDATRFELGDVFVPIDQSQVSQEFQLNVTRDNWSGVFGAYYLKEEFTSDQRAFGDDLFTFFGFPTTVLTEVRDDQETTSYAVFGHVDYSFNDALSLAAGVRYTWEEKEYEYERFDFLNGAPFAAFAFAGEEDWSAVTPSLTLEYSFNPDLMTYASVARGFKSGGFNGRARTAAEGEAFDPEKVWTYELGLKTTIADHTTVNLAAFFNDYEDFQARVADQTAGPGVSFALPVLNAGELETRGVELEIASSPSEHINLFAAVGYLDAEYKEFIDAQRDRSDDTVPFAPEWTARFGGSYAVPLQAGAFSLGADASFKAEHYLSVDNREVLSQDDFWLYNAFIRYEDNSGWYLETAVKNIADEVYKTDAQEFSSVGNVQTAYYGDPRTWTMTLGLSF